MDNFMELENVYNFMQRCLEFKVVQAGSLSVWLCLVNRTNLDCLLSGSPVKQYNQQNTV